jgi:hypothetical protein
LKDTVDKLEAELRVRLTENFIMKEDPLDLARVIHTKSFLDKYLGGEMRETETRMRLSCTVTSDKTQTAIVKYRGRSHVLRVSDKIGDYSVESIGVNTLVLRRGGERLRLQTEKAPDTIAEEEKRFGPDGEKRPVINVRQIPAGNS